MQNRDYQETGLNLMCRKSQILYMNSAAYISGSTKHFGMLYSPWKPLLLVYPIIRSIIYTHVGVRLVLIKTDRSLSFLKSEKEILYYLDLKLFAGLYGPYNRIHKDFYLIF